MINEYFPDRALYLYDTFDGFSEIDLEIEQNLNYSKWNSNDFSNTSEDLVLANMPYKENVFIKKGYFPDTFEEHEQQFCFVNLDMDLYQPIKSALEIFWPRMTKGGCICVHDYFSPAYKGVHDAVQEFLTAEGVFCVPVGDGLSVAIIKN